MQITVTGKQLDVGESLRSHAIEALNSSVLKHFEKAEEALVFFARDKHNIKADIVIHPMHGIKIKGSAALEDPYNAFDAALERVLKQLKRYKSRIMANKNKPVPVVEAATRYVIDNRDDLEELPAEADNPLVIAEMTAEIPTCTVSEAVMRLDLAEVQAMMFRNAAHGGLNVVYRRADGHIGWIDPNMPKS